MAMGESQEHKVIRNNLTDITQLISSDPSGPMWFAQKLVEMAFIGNAAGATAKANTEYEQTSKLMDAVMVKIRVSKEPQKEFAAFLKILQSNPCLLDLAEKLQEEYENQGLATPLIPAEHIPVSTTSTVITLSQPMSQLTPDPSHKQHPPPQLPTSPSPKQNPSQFLPSNDPSLQLPYIPSQIQHPPLQLPLYQASSHLSSGLSYTQPPPPKRPYNPSHSPHPFSQLPIDLLHPRPLYDPSHVQHMSSCLSPQPGMSHTTVAHLPKPIQHSHTPVYPSLPSYTQPQAMNYPSQQPQLLSNTTQPYLSHAPMAAPMPLDSTHVYRSITSPHYLPAHTTKHQYTPTSHTPDSYYTHTDMSSLQVHHTHPSHPTAPTQPQPIPGGHDSPHPLRVPPEQPYTPAPTMHPIDEYAKYLRSYYQSKTLPNYSRWPPTSATKFIHLAVVKKRRVSKQEADDFTKLTLHGNIDDIIRVKDPLDFSGVGIQEDGSPARFILVEGAPGIGKTTFAWEVSRKWSRREILHNYRLVVLLRLRDKRVREAKTIRDLFYHFDDELRREVAKEIRQTNGGSVLLLYEGYDELPGKLQTEKSIFLDILNRKCLPKATVLITSRPCATEFLQVEFKGNIDQHIEILGFTSADIQSYIQNVLKEQSLRDQFSHYLECYPHIQGLMYVPLNAVIVTEIYEEAKLNKSQEVVPTTLTEVYTSLTRVILLRYLKGHNEYGKKTRTMSKFSDLPEELHKQFHRICGIAFQGILKDEFIFDNLPQGFITLDLMQSVPELYVDQGAVVSHNFFHLTLQEFLAAVHVSLQPKEEQLQHFLHEGSFQTSAMSVLPTATHKNAPVLIYQLGKHAQSSPEILQVQKLTKLSTSQPCLPKLPTTLHHRDGLMEEQLQHFVQPRQSRLQLSQPDAESSLESSSSSTPMSVSPTDEQHDWTELQSQHPIQSRRQSPPTLLSPSRLPNPSIQQSGLQQLEDIDSSPSSPSRYLRQSRPLQLLQPEDVESPPRLSPLVKPTLTTPSVHKVRPKQLLLASNHLQNVQRFTAGLTKFKSIPLASLEHLLVEGYGDQRKITLNSLHWLFEAQCVSTYNNIVGDKDMLKFRSSGPTMAPFDCFVLGHALSQISCAWNIDLTASHIGDVGLAMLVAGMKYSKPKCPQSIQLNLSLCDITSEGLSHMSEMRQEVAGSVTDLNLEANFGVQEGVVSLLSKLKSVKTLDLGGTELSPTEIQLLAELLSHSNPLSLDCLKLYCVLKSAESTGHIFRALCRNTTLRGVHIWRAHVSEGNTSLLTSALKTNTTLRKLTLGDCKINDHTACEMSSALCCNPTLEVLYLSDNSIGDEGAVKLACSLKHNTALETLELYGNPIGNSGATAFAEMLRENKTLKRLDLRHCPIGEEGFLNLVQSLKQNTTLKKLGISDMKIPPELEDRISRR